MRMKKLLKAFYRAAVFAGILATFTSFYACSSHMASYDLYVSGSLDKETSSINGKRILVYTKKETSNLILEMETAEKIKKALSVYGYTSVDNLSNADYVLLFEYSIDSGEAVSYTEDNYTLNPVTNRYERSRSTNTEIEYTKELTLSLFSAQKLSKTSEPLWIGKAYIRDTSFNLRKAIDYLLVAAFEHFGEDTAEDIAMTITSDDIRIKRLGQAVHQ